MDILKRLQKAQGKYESAIGWAEQQIVNKIEFDFSVQWQPSDGWTIVSEESRVAPLEFVINIIKEKGTVSLEDFENLCI